MKILILGAGQTGGTLAENLARDAFDITLVDQDAGRLQELKDRLDIQTIHGHASRPDTLRQAGAGDADVLIAVTNSDEVNMVACQVCYSLYQTPKKIARIRSRDYFNDQVAEDEDSGFFSTEHMPIDVLINPERAVMEQIRELLEHPGALQVLDFAGGLVQLVAMRAYHDGPLVGLELRTLRDHIPTIETKIVAIFRQGQPIVPTADTLVQADDDVFFIAAEDNIKAVMAELRHVQKHFKSIVIAGGGNIGLLLAHQIENDFQIKVIESNASRAELVSRSLQSRSVAILGDATNRDLLVDENVQDADAFCAVTNNDEVNIMSALLAKRLGVRQAIALINKPAYVDVLQGSEIDVAVSPQLATISSMLPHLRGADFATVHRLRRGAAEAIEAVVHGDERNSRLVGRAVGQVSWPKGVTIGAIVRRHRGRAETIIAWDDVVIQDGDHVVLFMIDRTRIRAVERLVQVGIGFF